MTTGEGVAVLVKKEDVWRFEPDDGRADAEVVDALLQTISNLKAVAFIDDAPASLAGFGLDDPQATIRLTIPGREQIERIAVGGYTDQQTKRLMYVRRNESASIAKVRSSDVADLVQGPRHYRDRAVVEVLPVQFERIVLSAENPLTGERQTITLARPTGAWRMVEPVEAAVQEELVDQLVDTLSSLRAEQVVADEAESSAYGLHAPNVVLELSYQGLADPGGDESAAQTGTITLSMTAHEGGYYARRSDRPAVYRVSKDFYDQIMAEYRSDRVVDFDETEVRRFAIRRGDVTHAFVKDGERWRYEAEPDLPLDAARVMNLLLQVRDLRTSRYVRHLTDDLTPFHMDDPAHEVVVALADGTNHILWVSDQSVDGSDGGFYAAVEGGRSVFLLTADSVNRFDVPLDDLEEKR